MTAIDLSKDYNVALIDAHSRIQDVINQVLTPKDPDYRHFADLSREQTALEVAIGAINGLSTGYNDPNHYDVNRYAFVRHLKEAKQELDRRRESAAHNQIDENEVPF